MLVEERLDLGITYGTTATITTNTAIVESLSGRETRSINWVQPLIKFNIGQRGCINQELESFIAFHRARKGAYEGFRFKDWSDYQLSNQLITLNQDLQAQLFKTYTVAGVSVKRPLVKIVEETVTVNVGNSPVTEGWEVDFNTGVITFDEQPTGAIRVSCEFDVPVRFESDKIDLRFEAYEPGTGRKIFNWEGLTLTEVRISPAIPLPLDPVPQNLDHAINLGYDYGTVGGQKFATRIEKLVSGQEQRTSEWATSRGSWEVGSRTLLKSELDYLIALFRVCRGKAVSFRYFDWGTESEKLVRFGEDAIAFRFDAYEPGTERVIFNLAGVPLVGLFVFQSIIETYGQTFDGGILTNYSFTIIAPENVPSSAEAYLEAAGFDDILILGNFNSASITGSNLAGDWTGNFFLGVGLIFEATIVNNMIPACGFIATIRWEW